MRNKTLILQLLVLIITLIPLTTAVHAQSIKERMASRIPTINALKDKGLVGENNRGFLEYRTGNRPHKNVVAAENHDRQAVYTAIAKKEGASAALVGQRRAKMLASIGKKGQWFQSPDGRWYRK